MPVSLVICTLLVNLIYSGFQTGKDRERERERKTTKEKKDSEEGDHKLRNLVYSDFILRKRKIYLFRHSNR